ncbi:MAG: phage portal protein [Mycetocola sp.]
MAEIDTLLKSLLASLDQARLNLSVADGYYEGEQPITFIAPALQAEFGDRICALILNWPRMVADAYEARLDVEGFRYAGNSSADDKLWAVWQANDLDEQSQQAHLDSVALSRSYVLVGSGDSPDDMPIVTVESAMQVFARRDPRTRKITAAVKRWGVGDASVGPLEQHAMLYLPNSTRHMVLDGSKGWRVSGKVDDHDLGRPPVAALVNKPRILRPDGISEFHDVIPLADAANKMATDMMVSGEYHAMPRRWAVGMKDTDFQDSTGTVVNAWSRDAGTLWATENTAAKFGQFTESDLAVFHNTIKFLGQRVAEIAGLPPHYMGNQAENPASADAIRSSESQLVKRVERKQTYLGGAWEDVMRLILRFQTGKWDDKARSLETIWRDPSTPTVAQKADAIIKLATPLQNGRAIIPIEQAREDLGYTPEQRRRMAEMDRLAEQDPYLAEQDAKAAADAAARGTDGAATSAPVVG